VIRVIEQAVRRLVGGVAGAPDDRFGVRKDAKTDRRDDLKSESPSPIRSF
jgi:hypothetical protein